MRIGIIGARGFIGKYFTDRYIQQGQEVDAITRDNLDITSYRAVSDWVKDRQPDVIINCVITGGGANASDVDRSIVQSNISIFQNFYNTVGVKRYINIGSGAEFDRTKNLSNVNEHNIFSVIPTESYGYSKNVIARMCKERTDFYTLRLFGCCHHSESSQRILKKVSEQLLTPLTIHDKHFDMFNLEDFARVVDYYLVEGSIKDINCVYPTKEKLLPIVKRFVKMHSIETKIVNGPVAFDYTGSGRLLESLNLPLLGLDEGLKKYYE